MGAVGSVGMGPGMAVLAAGTRRPSTLTQGRGRWGASGEGWERSMWQRCWSPGRCLWLKCYFWRSRSPEFGLGPGSAGVRSKRAGGCPPLPRALLGEYVSSWVSEDGSRDWHFFFGPATSFLSLLEGENYVQGTEISVVPGKHCIRQEFPGHFSTPGPGAQNRSQRPP